MGLLLCAASASRGAAALHGGTQHATRVVVDGAISPATSRYVERGLAAAQRSASSLVILQLDTPGGLDSATRDIVRAILAARMPVVVYVAPGGARAASAGTYILYASHVAAMAPATNVGAATPVPIGGPAAPTNPRGDRDERGQDGGGGPAPPGNALERKIVNDAAAYVRGLAQLRGRNAAWAEEAVREGASLSAEEALKQNVVDLIARDVPDLLRQLHGRTVAVADAEYIINTEHVLVEEFRPDWPTRLLSILAHPTIAYGLLLIGLYGLLLEALTPGAVFPGVLGAISLLVSLFAFQLLSINFSGVALVILGVGLITAEFFLPTYGSLGIGGLAVLVIGSVMLADAGTAGSAVPLPLVAGVATVAGLGIAALSYLAARIRRRPATIGVETMPGAVVEVVIVEPDRCLVRHGAELWRAQALGALQPGQRARIVKVENMVLSVEPIGTDEDQFRHGRAAL